MNKRGIGFVADDAVFLESDGAIDFSGGQIIDFGSLFLVVFVVGGAIRMAVFVVECDFSGAVMEGAFADYDAAVIVIGPCSVKQVVFETTFSQDAAVVMIDFVGTVFPAMHVGGFLAFVAVGHVDGFHSFDGVVDVNAVGVQKPVFVIPAEFAVAFAVFHVYFHLYRIGHSVEIGCPSMLLFPFVLDDGLGVSIGVVGGFRVGAGGDKKCGNCRYDAKTFCHFLRIWAQRYNFLNKSRDAKHCVSTVLSG